MLNGIAIAIIQVISPCSDGKTAKECHDEFGPFFGRMMSVFTIISILITATLPKFSDYKEIDTETGEYSSDEENDESRKLLR